MSLRRLSRPLGLALSGLLATAALAARSRQSAQARIAAPSGLAPTGATSSSTPTFTWNRVPVPTQYELVISVGGNAVAPDDDGEQPVGADLEPAGRRHHLAGPRRLTRRQQLAGPAPSATISSTAAPTPVSPVGGDTAHPARQPAPVHVVAGRRRGRLRDPGRQHRLLDSPDHLLRRAGRRTSSTSPQAPGTWYWRVRANRGNGLYTAWSEHRDLRRRAARRPPAGRRHDARPPCRTSPSTGSLCAGATKYQLQVGKDPDFNNIVDDRLVMGTRFQPNYTYNNDQYYWRVRAIDAAGNRMPWTTRHPHGFQRNWPQAPQLEWPPNQLAPAVGDPMYFQWKPVPHASSYQLDISAGRELLARPVLHVHHHRHHVPDRLAARQRELLWCARPGPDLLLAGAGDRRLRRGPGHLLEHRQVRLRHRAGHPDLPGGRRHRRRADPLVEPARESNQYEVTVKNKNSQIVAAVDTYATSLDAGDQARPRGGSLHLDRRVARRLGRQVTALLRHVLQPLRQRPDLGATTR